VGGVQLAFERELGTAACAAGQMGFDCVRRFLEPAGH